MVRARRCLALVLLASLMIPALAGQSPAFDSAAHRDLALRALRDDVSVLDRYLREELSFTAGTAEQLERSRALGLLRTRQAVSDWIRDGAIGEDVPALRVRHHFHDPTWTWDQAGLRVFPLGQVGQSSVVWSQSLDQVLGGRHAWQDARHSFLRALTLPDPADRQGAFADTFETLGHLLHHVQDAASPAHTRNDPHLAVPIPGLGAVGDHDGLHEWAEVAANRDPALARAPVRADRSILDLPANPLAPVPVARLIDTERYRLTGQPHEGTDAGLAEYSAASFFSDDTVFSPDFPFPGPGNLELGPPEPIGGGQLRRYLYRVRDGQRGERLAVPSALHDTLPLALADQDIGLDDRVHADYAALLLPRAVGYSADLLDYFFRGRLDGDVVHDDTDPARVRFEGANASPERLEGGTLELYADTPESTRSRLAPVEPDLAVVAEPGAPVRSAPFQASPGAERYVAVYRGALGGEAPFTSSERDPGAVIGKVLGGVRVEQLLSAGAEWRIRTPRGVFGFEPRLQTAEYELVRWGDARDLLVARTAFGPGRANRVAVFRLDRPPGSIDLPTVTTPDGPRVPLAPTAHVTLPAAGIDTGSVVQYRQTSHHAQRLIRKDIVLTWTCEIDPLTGQPISALRSIDSQPAEVLAPVSATAEFARTVPVLLDAAHHFDPDAAAADYAWEATDVTVDAGGRVLLTALVFTREPALAPFPVPRLGIDKDTGAPVPVGQDEIPPQFPQGAGLLLWALVDLGAGRVITTTADPVITLAQTTYHQGAPDIWHRSVSVGECGSSGPRTHAAPVPQPAESVDADVTIVTGPHAVRTGEDDIVIAGLLRTDVRAALASAGFVDATVVRGEHRSLFAYDCSGGRGGEPIVCLALDMTSQFSGAGRNPAELEAARRPPAQGGSERLAVVARDYTVPGTPPAALAVLDAEPPRTTLRHVGTADAVELGHPASTSVLLAGEASGDMTTTLLSLDGSRTPVDFPGEWLVSDFTLLEPRFLYRPADMRFYRLAAPLQATALPAPLAGANLPSGSYHTVRLP